MQDLRLDFADMSVDDDSIFQFKPQPKKDWKLSDFEFGKKLGKGILGRVFCVREKKTKFICALKCMDIEELKKQQLQVQLQREVEIQTKLNHPNILRLFTVFWDQKRVYLVTEYAIGGELFGYLRKNGRFSERRSSLYAFQIASALEYMHSLNVIHRDIKLENILVGSDGNLKVADFGWSITSVGHRRTLCGTLDYLAPEIVENRSYDFHVDIWSLGILIYEFLVGTPPFENPDVALTKYSISSGVFEVPSFVSDEGNQLIRSILCRNPQKRISLKEIKEHKWILKYKDDWDAVPSLV